MIEYILIATIILLTGSIWGWAIPAITVLQIVLSLGYFIYIKGIDIRKMHIQKNNLIMIGVLLIVYVFNMVIIARINIFSIGYILIFAQIVCLFLIVESVYKENFIHKYINIILVLSTSSLLFWALAQIGITIAPMIIEPGNGYIYKMNLFYIYRSYSHLPILNEFNTRNFGIFWEAGVYQTFVNIALFWLIDQRKNVKFFYVKAVILVLTVITTFSSTGYFVLIFILLFYVIKLTERLNFKKKMIMAVIALGVAIGILSSPAVVNKFSSDSPSYISFKIRMNDNISGAKVALESPIWGLGYNSTKYFTELKKVGIIANSSGILSTAQKFGILFAAFLIFWQCKNFSSVLMKRNVIITLIASLILILIFSSEPLTLYQFYLLWVYKFASRPNDDNYPTNQIGKGYSMKKKSIAIDATGGQNWIGGLYYKKNIIFSLLQNQDILVKYNIIILTNQGNDHLFNEFSGKAKIILLPNLSKRMNKWFMLLTFLRYNCRYIFPYSGKKFFSHFGIKEIYWIPDFQECHYPQFFSQKVIKHRKAISVSLVNSRESLVLSSNAANNDLTTFFGPKKEIAVVPFVSYIEKEIKEISETYEQETLNKYEIDKGKFICICNQFWQHKNHVVVLKAIKELVTKYPENDIKFVFTGELKDYRNKEYFEFLQGLLENTLVSSRCKILGFIDRKEQIVLIKNSKCLIQPSLFEGWGTVLEDAKVLDKLVILSDIPVHREQKNENCILFDPHNPQDLMRAIVEVDTTNHVDNISKGLENMYANARAYSKNFEAFLRM